MKINCSYCNSVFDDTLTYCPSCGSPNAGVKRAADGQPLTIEQLKQWYQDRGLPPYETTRFFIGQDYKGARAFGIYKDEATGNFVVYKNKDTGARAVRYEGTDEAYAVNELLQRLKQEILQQKGAGNSGNTGRNANRSNTSATQKNKSSNKRCCLFSLAAVGGVILTFFLICILITVIEDDPNKGYYYYNDCQYYYLGDTGYSGWYTYSEDSDWAGKLDEDTQVPSELKKNKKAKKYFQRSEWAADLDCTDFTDSLVYSDIQNNYCVDTGYYSYNGNTYYHLENSSTLGWFLYSYATSDWDSIDYSSVPDTLIHDSTAMDYYYTPEWDSSTQVKDFTDTEYYSDYWDSQNSGSSSSSGSSWYDDDDDDYSWDSGSDSWDSGSSDWGSDW